MQTYTHFVMTAVLAKRARRRAALGESNLDLPPVQSQAALLGSIAPDLPLIFLAIILVTADSIEQRRLPAAAEAQPSRVGRLFQDHFFSAWWVKLPHNLFHAPLLTIGYVVVGYRAWKSGRAWGASLFNFGLATLLHTAIDIPIHHDDGPLLLFPFEWETRFRSPVSYWDRKRYGGPFTVFEHGLLLVMLAWLFRAWRREQR